MLIDHVEKGARCTVACMPVPIEEASAFGVMAVDGTIKLSNSLKNQLTRRQCRTIQDKSLASMGIYVFDADYLYELLKKTIAMRTPATTLAKI